MDSTILLDNFNLRFWCRIILGSSKASMVIVILPQKIGFSITACAQEQPDHSMKMIPPQVRHRLFAKNVSPKKRGVPDDASPTSAEAVQKHFADEIISFHSCGVTTFAPTAARDQRQVVTSSSLRPPWLSVSPPEICDQMFGKQNKL